MEAAIIEKTTFYRRVAGFVRFCARGAAAVGLFAGTAVAGSMLHYGVHNRPMDPLFNLPYDPAQVRFDDFDVSRAADCAPFLGSLGARTGHVKLFGHMSSGGMRVVVVGDEDPRAARGLSGLVFVMRDGGCKMSGPLAALRRTAIGDPDLDPNLTATDVAALMQDIMARYSRAFGGKDAFLAWTDRLTAEAVEAQREQPGMPCPLLYTSMFSARMKQIFGDFRASNTGIAVASR